MSDLLNMTGSQLYVVACGLQSENTTLRTRLAEVEADSAVMRQLLGDLLFDRSDHFEPDNLDDRISIALATNAGKSLLERLKKAESLLECAHPGMHTCETGQWFTDRDAFLNPTNNPKDKE